MQSSRISFAMIRRLAKARRERNAIEADLSLEPLQRQVFREVTGSHIACLI